MMTVPGSAATGTLSRTHQRVPHNVQGATRAMHRRNTLCGVALLFSRRGVRIAKPAEQDNGGIIVLARILRGLAQRVRTPQTTRCTAATADSMVPANGAV